MSITASSQDVRWLVLPSKARRCWTRRARSAGPSRGTASGQSGTAATSYMTTALFPLPHVPKDRVVLGGVTLRARIPEGDLLPGDARGVDRLQAGRGRREPAGHGRVSGGIGRQCGWSVLTGGYGKEPFAASAGWTEGKPEVSRNLYDVFRRAGARHQVPGDERGCSRPDAGSTNSFIILGVALAAAGRRAGADLSQRQQGSRAGALEVRLRVQRVARTAHAAVADPPLRGDARAGSHQGASEKTQEYYASSARRASG